MHQTADKYKIGFICTALAIVTLAVFWQVHNFEFVNYDDNHYITENQHITTGLIWENVVWVFKHGHHEHGGHWHPVTGLSHILDCQLFGLQPGWHHLVNLLCHIANVLLLFTVLRKMTGALWASAFVAALFAIHPLNVESVAWISERKNVLSTLFWFLTMAMYCRYIKKPGVINYLFVLALFALGLMSKAMLVTLPFVLLLLDYWPLGRLEFNNSGQMYRLAWEKIPFFILSALVSVITFAVHKSGGFVIEITALPLTLRITNTVVSYAKYIQKLFVPTGLVMYYPYPVHGVLVRFTLTAGLLLLAITILTVLLGKKYRYLPVGWFWYLGTLVPVIGIVQVCDQAMADRYAYIPLIGLFIIVAWGANDLLAEYRYRKIILSVTSLTAISILSFCAFFQTGYWRNSQILFEHASNVTTGNYLAYNNLGKILFDQNKFDEALNCVREALKIRPNYPFALMNFGFVYSHLHPQDDIEACRRALEVQVDSLEAYSYLGLAYERTDRYKNEIEAYKQTIKIKPDNAEAYNKLGTAYSKVGHWEDAIEMCKKSIEIKPDFAQAYNNLGSIYGLMRRYEEAIQSLEQAVKIKPDYAEAYRNLGFTFDKLNRYQEAREFYMLAVKNKPDYADAYNQLGADLGRLGQHEKAIEAFREVVRIDPNNMEAYGNIGVTYDKLGRLQEAIQAFKQAIKISPDAGRLHFLLGSVYLKAGDKESAKKEYEILKTLADSTGSPQDAEKAAKLLELIKKKN